MRAVRAEPPELLLARGEVDLVNGEVASTGVERVPWGEVGNRACRRARVLARRPLPAGLVALVLLTSSSYDGPEVDAVLRERVVWQQALTREQPIYVLVLYSLDDVYHCSELVPALLDLLLEGAVGGLPLQLRYRLLEGLALGPVALAQLPAVLEDQQHVQIERCRREVVRHPGPHDERPERLYGLLVIPEVVPEHVQEGVQQHPLVRLDEVEEVVGELQGVHLPGGDDSEAGPHVLWHDRGVPAGEDPAVHAEGDQLPLENGGGMQEHPRGLHDALEHFLGGGIEVHAPRVRVREDEAEGVSVTPAGATDALEELCLSRWHAAEHKRRKVTNVNAHLEGGCAGEDVRVPGH